MELELCIRFLSHTEHRVCNQLLLHAHPQLQLCFEMICHVSLWQTDHTGPTGHLHSVSWLLHPLVLPHLTTEVASFLSWRTFNTCDARPSWYADALEALDVVCRVSFIGRKETWEMCFCFSPMRNFIYIHIYMTFFFFFNCWTSRSSDPYTAVQIGALTSWDIVAHFGALRITLERVTGNLALHHAFENTASTCSQSNSLNGSPQNRAGGTYSRCQHESGTRQILCQK